MHVLLSCRGRLSNNFYTTVFIAIHIGLPQVVTVTFTFCFRLTLIFCLTLSVTFTHSFSLCMLHLHGLRVSVHFLEWCSLDYAKSLQNQFKFLRVMCIPAVQLSSFPLFLSYHSSQQMNLTHSLRWQLSMPRIT